VTCVISAMLLGADSIDDRVAQTMTKHIAVRDEACLYLSGAFRQRLLALGGVSGAGDPTEDQSLARLWAA
jgi:hypothetical protein